MIDQLYLDIIEQLKTIVTDEETPKQVLKHFELWNRQTEYAEEEAPFKMPAVFIEFLPVQWEQLGKGIQEADIMIRLHIIWSTKKRNKDGDKNQTDALSGLKYPGLIHYAMRRLNLTYTGRPVRTDSETDHDHRDVIDNIETYKIRAVDNSAAPYRTEVNNVMPVINPPEDEPES